MLNEVTKGARFTTSYSAGVKCPAAPALVLTSSFVVTMAIRKPGLLGSCYQGVVSNGVSKKIKLFLELIKSTIYIFNNSVDLWLFQTKSSSDLSALIEDAPKRRPNK